jgi:hypothetical protein
MSHLVKQITLESFQKDNEAIKELIELGFLERDQERVEGGLFGNINYKIKYTSPRPKKEDTDETQENQEVKPCPKKTDTVKTGNRKVGHKKDLSFKKDSSSKKEFDDDAERIPEKVVEEWKTDFKYIAFREIFTKTGASDIKKHDEHYKKFLDACDSIRYGELIIAAEKYVKKEGKKSQIVLFLSGLYNQYLQKENKPASRKRATTSNKPVSFQDKVLEREQQRIAKEEIETGVGQTATGIDEDQKVLDDVLKTFHFLRSTEKQVRKH